MANQVKVAISSSIIALRQQGWSFRRIAEALGVHRETVARYVHLAEAGAKPATNLSTGSEAESRAESAEVTAGDGASDGSKPANLSAGNPGPKSLCEPFLDVIRQKLDQGASGNT